MTIKSTIALFCVFILIYGCSADHSSVEKNNADKKRLDSLIIDDYQILNSTLVHLVSRTPPGFEREFGYDNFDYSERNIPSGIIKDIYIVPLLLDVSDTNGFRSAITGNSIPIGEIDSLYLELFHRLVKSCPASLPIDLTRITNRGLNNLITVDPNNKPKLEISERIVSYSRIVYNDNRDKACFYFENNCAGFCGFGSFVFVKKENGIWKIDSEIMDWIS